VWLIQQWIIELTIVGILPRLKVVKFFAPNGFGLFFLNRLLDLLIENAASSGNKTFCYPEQI